MHLEQVSKDPAIGLNYFSFLASPEKLLLRTLLKRAEAAPKSIQYVSVQQTLQKKLTQSVSRCFLYLLTQGFPHPRMPYSQSLYTTTKTGDNQTDI